MISNLDQQVDQKKFDMVREWENDFIDCIDSVTTNLDTFIYFLEEPVYKIVKIGRTNKYRIKDRISAIRTCSPLPLILVGGFLGTIEDEKRVHNIFKFNHYHGEWYMKCLCLDYLINKTVKQKGII